MYWTCSLQTALQLWSAELRSTSVKLTLIAQTSHNEYKWDNIPLSCLFQLKIHVHAQTWIFVSHFKFLFVLDFKNIYIHFSFNALFVLIWQVHHWWFWVSYNNVLSLWPLWWLCANWMCWKQRISSTDDSFFFKPKCAVQKPANWNFIQTIV